MLKRSTNNSLNCREMRLFVIGANLNRMLHWPVLPHSAPNRRSNIIIRLLALLFEAKMWSNVVIDLEVDVEQVRHGAGWFNRARLKI